MAGYLNWDWELEIKFNPQELGGDPYQIFFFLGPVPSSPSEWLYAPSRMFEPVTSHIGNPITEYRSINGVLEHHCGREIKDDEVLPYLRKNFSWRVKKVRGSTVR